MAHRFRGKWVTDQYHSELKPWEVFHRQLSSFTPKDDGHTDEHLLFRGGFDLENMPKRGVIYITADDFYKLYVNGRFVTMGPAPSYSGAYNYNELDITEYLNTGRNVIAVHVLYQGLINRVWQSGDGRCGLIFDVECDGKTVLASGEELKIARHRSYTVRGKVGYDTQFLEDYDARAEEVGFEEADYDDSAWERASIYKEADHILSPQRTKQLTFEVIKPVNAELRDGRLFLDFGKNYVGYLTIKAMGKSGTAITVRQGQELNGDGSVRYDLRANCVYEESFILGSGESVLDQYDYKSARYAELILPEGCRIIDAYFTARHYPFRLCAKMKPEYEKNAVMRDIWELCTNTFRYGTQEALLDCMEREKGFYLGDGCYTAATHALLTGEDDMLRKLIDDAFRSEFITDTLMTCMNGSFMQEIAEYPLMLTFAVLFHYRLTEDKEYLAENFGKCKRLLDAYRRDYEQELLLRNLDKWCVVEWPANFRDGYDVDLKQGKICTVAHTVMNAHYFEAIRNLNRMAKVLGLSPYRNEDEVKSAIINAFYNEDEKMFCDSEESRHMSIVANVFSLAYDLFPDEESEERILSEMRKRGISSVGIFTSFPWMLALARRGLWSDVSMALTDGGAWKRMLREDATTTFEGWGKDTKWNTSLFHMTMAFAALFLADADINTLLR